MAGRPMMGFRITPDLKRRIERIAERDNTTASNVVYELVVMAIDAREKWQPQQLPKLEIR